MLILSHLFYFFFHYWIRSLGWLTNLCLNDIIKIVGISILRINCTMFKMLIMIRNIIFRRGLLFSYCVWSTDICLPGFWRKYWTFVGKIWLMFCLKSVLMLLIWLIRGRRFCIKMCFMVGCNSWVLWKIVLVRKCHLTVLISMTNKKMMNLKKCKHIISHKIPWEESPSLNSAKTTNILQQNVKIKSIKYFLTTNLQHLWKTDSINNSKPMSETHRI